MVGGEGGASRGPVDVAILTVIPAELEAALAALRLGSDARRGEMVAIAVR